MTIQVLIPISSFSNFFSREEYYFPKPLIEIAGRPMIDHVISTFKKNINSEIKYIFVCEAEVLQQYSLDATLKILTYGSSCSIISKNLPTSGSLSSCLLAIDELDPEKELIISNSDQIIDADISIILDYFRGRQSDVGLVSFPSVHPRWSYIYTRGGNAVDQVAEKRVISDKALTGFYYYKSASIFVETAKLAILDEYKHDNQYFISGSVNQAILQRKCVHYKCISSEDFHSLYSPAKITEYESLFSQNRNLEASFGANSKLTVVIPAAGQGSRFAKAGWKKPKPFIDINGAPMLNLVVNNTVPANAQCRLLLREEHIIPYSHEINSIKTENVHIDIVQKLTEGTACTVLQSSDSFTSTSLLVANSDQFVDFDVEAFLRDARERQLDGSILVFKEPTMDPKWSYAQLDLRGYVTKVAEKTPISELATVGIYYFSSGQRFINAASKMIANNDRVNNEFYVCPVYNYMISGGAKVGVFEVDKSCMWGLGTPEDLNSYLQAHHLSASLDAP